MVEHRHAIGELRGMVIRHEEAARTDAHPLGLEERLRHEEIGRGMRFPGRGVMLPDPRLAEAQLVGPAELLQVPLVPVVELALRRMRRHGEESVVHGALLGGSGEVSGFYATSAVRVTSWTRPGAARVRGGPPCARRRGPPLCR